jgi:sugar lactone lactonase YvrE
MQYPRSFPSYVAVLAAFWLVAGCASAGSPPSGPLAPAVESSVERAARVAGRLGAAQPSRRAGGWLSPAAKSGKHLIYVADFTANAIQIYSTSGSNQSPVGQITDGISGPEGCFVDRHGNLFVANATNQTVTMYKRGAMSWSLQYTGFAYPTNVAVGANGVLYVDDLVGGKVVEFERGKTRSKRTILVTDPQGAALDAKNNLYVSYNTGSHGGGPGTVNKYPPKSTKGTDLDLPIVWSAGDAVDSKADVVVADQGSGSGNAAVYVFPPGSTQPSETIDQGMEDPFRLALDKKNRKLYVADPEVNKLLVYDYASGTLVNTITNGLSSVYGVAVSGEGS